MSNLIWDIYGCWYGKGISQPTGIIMCSVEKYYKGLDGNAVWKIRLELCRPQVHR